MVVIVTCSPAGIRVGTKYCSKSQRKFSKSLAFRAPTKGLGSSTHTFAGGRSEVDGVPCTIARFSNMISPYRDLVRSWNSSVMANTLLQRVFIRLSKTFSHISIRSHCEPRSRVASASRVERVVFASTVVPKSASSLNTSMPTSASILATFSCSASMVILAVAICGSNTNFHTPNFLLVCAVLRKYLVQPSQFHTAHKT